MGCGTGRDRRDSENPARLDRIDDFTWRGPDGDASEPASVPGAEGLYDQDFYAWTQQQATLLRNGRVAAIDLPNILEEIESLGRKEVADLRSRYRVLVQHLLKQMYQPGKSGRSWRTTVLRQRIEIARHMRENPSLKPKADAVFAEAYADARKLAASETGLSLETFPVTPPFARDHAEREG